MYTFEVVLIKKLENSTSAWVSPGLTKKIMELKYANTVIRFYII